MNSCTTVSIPSHKNMSRKEKSRRGNSSNGVGFCRTALTNGNFGSEGGRWIKMLFPGEGNSI